jgi:hypothetical protein
MADESDPEREAIHEAIQVNAGHVQDASGGAILTGWVVLAEWMDKDGDRYLSHCRAPSTSAWTARGMAHDYIYGEWGE